MSEIPDASGFNAFLKSIFYHFILFHHMWSGIFFIPRCGIWAVFYSPAAGRKQKKLLWCRSFAPADANMSPLQRTEACSHNWEHGASGTTVQATHNSKVTDPPSGSACHSKSKSVVPLSLFACTFYLFTSCCWNAFGLSSFTPKPCCSVAFTIYTSFSLLCVF